MGDKSNKKFWDNFAKLYAPFMKKDKEVYDKNRHLIGKKESGFDIVQRNIKL